MAAAESSAGREDGPPARARGIARALAGVLLVAGLVVITTLMYGWYEDASATPSRPAEPGQALLAFDRPEVPATMETSVEQGLLHFVISLPDDYPGSDVGFTLALSGLIAGPQGLGPADDLGPDGCRRSVYVVPNVQVMCTSTPMPKYGFVGNGPTLGPALAVQGRILRNSANKMFSQVGVPVYGTTLSTRAGKRSYFSLPRVGTTRYPSALGTNEYPSSLRAQAPLDYGTQRVVYPPLPLTISVDYRALASSERLDIVSPETLDKDQLTWVDVEHNSIQPHGSIVDTALEDNNQTTLFVVGIVAGLIGAVLPGVAKFVWRSWSKPFANISLWMTGPGKTGHHTTSSVSSPRKK